MTALAIGVICAAAYYAQGMTLSHYDAKAHLVVARRIMDSIRPGWVQIGAVWLPLPHLLNVLPVQVDWLYRTGLSGVVLSIAAFVTGATSLWWLVARATGSTMAAWAAFSVFSAQPDVLYLQATPMTEALLMGLCLLGVALTWRWVESRAAARVWPAGIVLALACLTRYEAWPITAATLSLSAVALILLGVPAPRTARRIASLAACPTAAILAFLALSRATIGRWFVTDGFYELDPSTYHRPLVAIDQVIARVRELNGHLMTLLAALGLVVSIVAIARRRHRASVLVMLALGACVLLPVYAFWKGHPFRIRYMVASTMSLAAVAGLGVGFLPNGRRVAGTLVIVTALIETPPLSSASPMLLEAQRDRPQRIERQRVTACLVRDYDQTRILASMGSLAHYMQELSWAGFSIRDFIHEGIGQLWADSLVAARTHVGWVLIEERAEGGDELARLRARAPDFLVSFVRVCEGGGVALYRRVAVPLEQPRAD